MVGRIRLDKKTRIIVGTTILAALLIIGISIWNFSGSDRSADKATIDAVKQAVEEAKKDAAAYPAPPPPRDASEMKMGKSRGTR